MSSLAITVSYSAGSLVIQGPGTTQVIQISTPGAPGVVQLGTLSAAANQQITQAVASAAASALAAAQYAAQLPSLVVQLVATFAALPASPLGLFLVVADETKGGSPSIYFFTSTHRYWIAMVQDA